MPGPTLPLPVRADLHIHTSHSHGEAGTLEMFAAARDRGLCIIGFSEHSPRPDGYAYAFDYQERLAKGFPRYIREVEQAAALGAASGVRVLLGIEVDYIAGREGHAAALCARYPYDYTIGGLHFQDAWGFDGPADAWEALEREARFAVYARYYEDLAALAATGLFNIAAHPDLIKIHTVDTFRLWLRTDAALPLIRRALEAMKATGMAMEISSAGLRKPCREIYPCPEIMALASELLLPVSFGSDAHCTGTPAFAFDRLARYAASFGYDAGTYFVQREARSLPFDRLPPL